ncbi:MAG: tetratricopeptide repeat protein, partial [Vampirovibrionia bacterium]
LLLGQAALDNEQYKQAKLAFLKVLNKNQKSAKAHEGLGETFLHLGKPLYAEDEFNKALQLSPGLIDSYIGLGIINQRRFDYNKALSYYRKAASINRNYYKAYIKLGEAYLEMGNVKQAITEFSKANNAEGNYWLGFSYLVNNDYTKAKAYFEKSININPFDARPYKDLSRIYLQEEELLKTRNLLDNAIGLDTNYSDAYYLLGLLDELESNKTSAAKNYILAYTIDPTSVSAYKKAYEIFKDEGELDKFQVPRPKFIPNSEEREFLIRILYLEGYHLKAATNYLNNMLANCRFGFLAIPQDYIGKETISNTCSNYLSIVKGIYNEVNELKAPAKFASVKEAFMEYLWSDANFIHKELTYIQLGIYPNNEKSVNLLASIDSAKNEIAMKKNSFYNLISTLKQKCDPISYDELTTYSGFDDSEWNIYNEKFKAIEERTLQALAAITPQTKEE